MSEYIYLLQVREFIKTKEPIYKIGKTKQEFGKRFNQYPKDSCIYLVLKVDNCAEFENKIKNAFDIKFRQRSDIGREYYEGNVNNMIIEITEIFRLNKCISNNFR